MHQAPYGNVDLMSNVIIEVERVHVCNSNLARYEKEQCRHSNGHFALADTFRVGARFALLAPRAHARKHYNI